MHVTAPNVIDTSNDQDVALYTDYKHDESYTPTRISVRVGTNFNDLQEIEVSLPFPCILVITINVESKFRIIYYEQYIETQLRHKKCKNLKIWQYPYSV